MTRFQFLQGLNKRLLPLSDMPPSGKKALAECANRFGKVYHCYGLGGGSWLGRMRPYYLTSTYYLENIYSLTLACRPKGIPGHILARYRRK